MRCSELEVPNVTFRNKHEGSSLQSWGRTGSLRFSEYLSWESPARWDFPQFMTYNLGHAALNCPLGSSRSAIFLMISDTLCIVSLSLTRCTRRRSLSLAQRASIASISLSSASDSDEFLRMILGVSGRMIRKVSLKVATKSILERCGGMRMLSRACKTAFRVFAEVACRCTSRVSLFTVY